MFKPNKEQLEKLAKVAKVDIDYGAYQSYPVFNYKERGGWCRWQPHEDRDQIAMVIEGLTATQLVQYELLLKKHTPNICTGQLMKASISCEKLLEVIG